MSAEAKIPKPNMRRLLETQLKKQIAISFVCSFAVAAAYKFLISDKRKEAYARFYKDYDPEKSFERMRSKGVFDSC